MEDRIKLTDWINEALAALGREDVNIFLRYENLFLDTLFSTPLPNFKSVALTSSSINSEQINRQKNIFVI